jgi:hypothetical protein
LKHAGTSVLTQTSPASQLSDRFAVFSPLMVQTAPKGCSAFSGEHPNPAADIMVGSGRLKAEHFSWSQQPVWQTGSQSRFACTVHEETVFWFVGHIFGPSVPASVTAPGRKQRSDVVSHENPSGQRPAAEQSGPVVNEGL